MVEQATGGPLTVWALSGLPEIGTGADLAQLILNSCREQPLQDGDIVVITSKVISKAEGRFADSADREAAIDAETVRVVATRGQTRIVENRLGVVGASAGIDGSNTPDGTIVLLPADPDASARQIAEALRSAGHFVGVIVTDTLGRPWREGQTDVAIGAAGVTVFSELVGQTDSVGRPLVVTRPCLADEIAAAADLVKGKTHGLPVAVVRGLRHAVGDLDLPGARSIPRAADKDLFRLGTDEAYAAGLAAAREEER